ncbi:MAG: hypothetical protein Ct9H90mP21_2840 [Methanobacteriota archaeon]|nr:MAG: hypothetical protein Ct9H90mP21_2840 [Euryarchaeota archaeon]
MVKGLQKKYGKVRKKIIGTRPEPEPGPNPLTPPEPNQS